jgi:glutamine synthetase
MTDYVSLRRRIDSDDIGFIDVRATDLVGRFRHVTIPAARFTAELMEEGVGFDGSNYGYRSVAGSDMVLVPDLSTAYVEERDRERILTVIANICEAGSRAPVAGDPRRVAQAAAGYLRECGVADELFVGPEFEFYVFDEVRYDSDAGRCCVEIAPVEGCDHRNVPELGAVEASAYHASPPQDRLFVHRCEMARQIENAGIPVKYHHHEVGPFGQQEIELEFGTLVRTADATLVVKSIVRNAASEMGFTATFLPKPIHGQAGSGMHLHQYLVKNGENLFNGDGELTELALCYIGGLLSHGRSLMGLTNSSTNSYRRLVPGHEAPVHLVFGSANRSAAIRIPAYAHGETSRIELRTVDATCNPYLAFAGILLAGIDGIERSLNATKLSFGPFDTDLYREGIGRTAPRSFDEALDALEEDHEYLLAGGVFSEELLEHWIRAKRDEVCGVSARPHPHEFSLYYDV